MSLQLSLRGREVSIRQEVTGQEVPGPVFNSSQCAVAIAYGKEEGGVGGSNRKPGSLCHSC